MIVKILQFAAVMLVLVFSLSLAAQSDTSTTSPGGKKAAEQKKGSDSDDGERVFEQQCARCHAAPDGFSSRISGTVVRHMRVRASLSKHDEEELLRFLNP
jgi:cytochrome c